MRTRSLALLTGAVLVVGAGPALAAWQNTGAGSTTASADSLKSVTGLGAVRQSRNVTTTFTRTALGDGKLLTDVGGSYDLTRNGTQICSQQTTCAERGLTPGSYTYTVTPKLGSWTGPLATTDVTVPPPTLTMGTTSFLNNRYTSVGTLDGFLDDTALTYYRLDGANNTTTPIAGTLEKFPGGQTTLPMTTVTIPCNSSAAASHTINVPGDPGTNVAGTLGYNFTSVLCPVSAQPGVAGDGRAATGDVIALAFNQAVDGNTICAGISATPNTADNLVATITDGGAGDDTLTLTAPPPNGGLLGLYQVDGACGAMTPGTTLGGGQPVTGRVNLGTISLGSPNYVTSGSVAFSGGTLARPVRTTISLSSAGTVMITLGSGSTTPALTSAAVTNAAPRWTPAGTITAGAKTAQGYALGTSSLF